MSIVEKYRLKQEELDKLWDNSFTSLYDSLNFKANEFAAKWQEHELEELGELPDPTNQFEWDDFQEKIDWVVNRTGSIRMEHMLRLVCKKIEGVLK